MQGVGDVAEGKGRGHSDGMVLTDSRPGSRGPGIPAVPV